MKDISSETPVNRDWLRRMADAEDRCQSVSVGGLAQDLGMLGASMDPTPLTRIALAKFVEFSRRKLGLTSEQFANQVDIDLAELVSLEQAEEVVPEPRTIYQLAQILKIPEVRLMELAGLAKRVDRRLDEAAIRFAACSEPMDKLSAGEQRALQEFVQVLADLSE